MPKNYIVSIPVSSYIKKYAEQRYGTPILLNNNNLLSTVIISLLGKEHFSTRTPLSDRCIQYSKYTQRLQCVGPNSLRFHLGYSINDHKAIQINRFLEEEFKERLHIFVSQRINTNCRRSGYYKVLEEFANHYNIDTVSADSDISFDGLVKMHYRYRQAAEKKTKKLMAGLSGQNQPSSTVPLILF